jgi:hypothetical protein
MAGKRQVLDIVAAAVLSAHDMFDVMRQPASLLGK